MRKHQKWLWGVIITVIIISFVVFFSPSQQMGMGDGPKFDYGSIKGKPITQEQINKARDEEMLSFRLRYREWPTEQTMRRVGLSMDREVYNRIAMIEKLKELKINVSEDAAVQLIMDIFGATGGAFPMKEYENLLADIEKVGLTKQDFERFVRHEVAQQHLVSLFGLGGKLVTPQEAEYFYRRDNELMTVDAVFFSASNYLSQVKTDPKALSNHFQLNMSDYLIPPRVQVGYIKLDSSNFLAQAEEQVAKTTNLNQLIDSHYVQKGGTNFFKDASGRPLSLEEARPKIKEQYRNELAIAEAHKKAAAFLSEFDNIENKNIESFEKLAAEKKLEVKQSPLFGEQADNGDFKVPANFRVAAFRLSPEDPFTTSPVITEDGVYIQFLTKQEESKIPAFESVKDKVTADYKLSEARKLARAAGDSFAKELTKGLNAGTKFETICAVEKVKPASLPPFSSVTRTMPELKDRLTIDRLRNASSRLAVARSSDFMATEEGGVVLYLRARTPVNNEKVAREIADYSKSMADQRQYAAYEQWYRELPEQMGLQGPTAEPQSVKQ